MEIYGNVLDASMAGGVFINGGGNISIKNNIVLNGRTSRAKNPFFARRFIHKIIMIILPRQARDKQKESTQKEIQMINAFSQRS